MNTMSNTFFVMYIYNYIFNSCRHPQFCLGRLAGNRRAQGNQWRAIQAERHEFPYVRFWLKADIRLTAIFCVAPIPLRYGAQFFKA